MNRSPMFGKALAIRLLALALVLAAPAPRSAAREARGGPLPYDLSLEIDAAPDPAGSGGQVTVLLTASNDGPGDAAPAVVEISTPEGTTFASASGGAVEAPEPGGTGSVRCTFAEGVAVGATAEVEAVFNVTAEPGATLLFEASVTGPNDAADDADPSNNEASTAVGVASDSEADVEIAIVPFADEAGSGALFTYAAEVVNVSEGEASAQGVTVFVDIPDGATFSSVASDSDQCAAPPEGGTGTVVCVFGDLAPGDSVEVDVTVKIIAVPGHTLELSASVETSTMDPEDGNNSAEEEVLVVPSPPTQLDWEEPDADAPVDLPPPRNLVVEEAGGRHERPSAARDTLVGYNVYGSTTPGVTPGPGNLLTTVPATTTNAVVPSAPSGTFFVVTAVYDDGESGPSNEASAEVPTATLAQVKVKPTKITATGRDFTDEVTVSLDGIPFAAPAKVKKANTKVIQKGTLVTGQSIGAYLAAHPRVVVMFRNSNGGVVAFTQGQ